jgi:hypothetical protein
MHGQLAIARFSKFRNEKRGACQERQEQIAIC